MANFNKRFTTRDGDTYAYDYVPPNDDKATFFLIHGYPSSRHDWRHQVADLTNAGYGVIAPDCLGYGDSDKRTDIEAYRMRRLSGHFAELLDHENISQVIGVGHDWGSILLSRAVTWHPEYFQKLVFVSAGYVPAGIFFDIDGHNAWSQASLGYTQLGYWYFFNSYDAQDVIGRNLESFFHMAYPDTNEAWKGSLGAIGGTRSWLHSDTKCPLPPWLTEEDKARFIRNFSQENAVLASVNYYRSIMRGVQVADEDTLADIQRIIDVPVLAIGGAEDMITRADQIAETTRPFASRGYTEKIFEGIGHWVMLEDRERFSRALLDFVVAEPESPPDEDDQGLGPRHPC